MKCPSCSADNVPGATFCEYCGTALGKKPTVNEIFDKNTGSETAQTNNFADMLPKMSDPVYQLWSTKCTLPINKFNWMAFLFPIGYLAGYGAVKSVLAFTFSMAGLFFIAAFLSGAMGRHFTYLSGIAALVSFVFSYRLSVRVESILGKKPNKAEFNWVAAIGFTILYMIIFSI